MFMYNKISHVPHKKFRNFLTWPFIYGMSIPLVVLDFFTELYHHVAFPLYGIPIVKRNDYIRIFDRQKLSYLKSPIDKMSCMYCGYANGFAAYMVRIAGDTEKYWCAIKHKESGGFVPQPHQKDFLLYDDKEAYDEFLAQKNRP